MTKKLHLNLDELQIESFATVETGRDRGTVQAYVTEDPTAESVCYSYYCQTVACTAYNTCAGTSGTTEDPAFTLVGDCSQMCTANFSCLICEVHAN